MEKKNSIIILIIVVVVAVLGLWALKHPKNAGEQSAKPSDGSQVTNNTSKPEPTVALPFATKDAPQEKLPDGFVKGFPLEASAKIITNQSAQTAAGLQSTRVFASAKSLDENYKIYNDYLKKNNWTILTSVDSPTFKSISAKNSDNVSLNLSISQNSVTKNIEVNIVFLQPIKK